MAEILLLPVQPCGLAQATRLHADLAAAHALGADLGSRAQHIQAGGEQLLELSYRLDDALADLDRTLRGLGLRDQEVAAQLRQLLGGIQNLAATAQRFSPAIR
jgi:hypothetical protein